MSKIINSGLDQHCKV